MLCLNRRRTAAAEAVLPREALNSFSVGFDGALLPSKDTLTNGLSCFNGSMNGAKLALKARVDARRSVEVAIPAEREAPPKLSPPLKARASAYGVFDDTIKMLKKLKASEHVKVRLKASDGTLTIEPPRRVFRLENGVEPVEVRVYFGDLREALGFFECAGFAPSVLMFSESVLQLETEYGNMKLRALIAGQPE